VCEESEQAVVESGNENAIGGDKIHPPGGRWNRGRGIVQLPSLIELKFPISTSALRDNCAGFNGV